MNIQTLLQNHDYQINIFIFFIGISLIQYFDIKIIISTMLFLLILVNYNVLINFGNTEEIIKQDIKKNDISDDMYYNTTIHDLLVELKYFKKYNKVSYKDGVKYMRKFFKTIHILEHDEIYNYNQYI